MNENSVDHTTRAKRLVLVAGAGVLVVIVAVVAVLLLRPRTPDPLSTSTPSRGSTSSSPAASGASSVSDPLNTGDSGCSAESPCLDPEPTAVTTASDGTPAAVEMRVTSSGWDEAAGSAWVAGVVSGVEAEATCTLRMQQGAQQVQVQVPAEAGPSTMSCSVQVPGTELRSGQWTASLEYSSHSRSGSGVEVTITVP